MSKKIVYLDHASTTPLDKKALLDMLPYFSKKFGNASNLYEMGRIARQAVESSKSKIARVLGCQDNELIFTGSATEADNLAIAGAARANKHLGNKIMISSVEHKGIIAVCEALKKEGFEVVAIPVDKNGVVDLKFLEKEIDNRTILVSVTMADSETGTIQPLKRIRAIITKKFNASGSGFKPYLHTDASQSSAYSDTDVTKLGIDLMTLSAHKIGGPKGIGALFIKKGIVLSPIIYGGGHQNRLRSGTENIPAIVGFGSAFQSVASKRITEARRIKLLRDRLERGILKSIPKIIVNGHPSKRLPNFSNISILDIEGEALLLHLDKNGIVANTGSACNSESLEPSYILTAQGNPYEFVHGSIRFTLGKGTTAKDIDRVLACLPDIVLKLRRISPLCLDPKSRKDGISLTEKRAFIGNQTPHFLRKKLRADNKKLT